MGSTMSSYTATISGMRAAQIGLNTVGHNMANNESVGYTRQMNVQNDYNYQKLKEQHVDSLKAKTGLGTITMQIRQIRNQFYDTKYRDANSISNFYSAKAEAGVEIETIFGELETDYTVQSIFTEMWNSVNDLVSHPDALETRSDFIQTCNTFVTEVKNVSDTLLEHQLNLNEQVKQTVSRVNELLDEVESLSMKIIRFTAEELDVNDYMDKRNLALDELSSLISIDIKTEPSGRVQIISEGKELLANGVCEHLGLKYSSNKYPFVIPVISRQEEIFAFGDDTPREFYPTLDSDMMSLDSEKTCGKLKGLLVSRGNVVADYTTSDSDTNNYLIPKAQRYFDTLVNSVVTLLNDTFCPKEGEQPADLYGDRTGAEIFIRSTGYDRGIDENPDDLASLYTTNNIEVNPLLLDPAGYNRLCLSLSGDPGDTDLLDRVTAAWKEGVEKLGGLSVDSYYAQFTTELAIEIEEAQNQSDITSSTKEVTDEARKSISGVSLDEELTTMLKYQYAFQSAAKMLSIIDSMVNKVINEMI